MKFCCSRQGTPKRDNSMLAGGILGGGTGGVFTVFGGPMAWATWVPMGAQIPTLTPNDHPNPSERQQRGLGKHQIFENVQVPLNSLNNGNFGAFGGPMHRAIWA